MSLSPGSRIGAYRVSSLIGAGGMGEVFLAVDVNLGRQAAIKVLPALLSGDPERLARFEREAQTLAALNHPNIAQVFGFEKGDDHFRALAMEYVEGPTLADRIGGVPIPVDEAIPIAIQIADALESAHDHGIIHRDLKPLNIKVRPDGTVKVLDFGLAKAILPSTEASGGISHSPTITTPAMTHAGVVLGTASYMSPEQAKGRVVDRRTDIWAFGCVLFEMLSGRRAFSGEDVSDVLVSILRDQPNWSSLPDNTPPHVRALLQRCLEKDPRKRLPHIGVARLDLSAPPPAREAAATTTHSLAVWRGVAVAALLAAIGVPAWMQFTRLPAQPALPTRLRAELGGAAAVVLTGAVAISADGRTLAFVGRPSGDLVSSLYVRSLDRLDAQQLSGTDAAAMPFFSPDGHWIAFFSGTVLKKVATSGGAVVTLCDSGPPRGGWWALDDSIVFASATGLYRVAGGGGTPQQIAAAEPARAPLVPQVLPNGRGILYTESANSDPASGTIVFRDLSGGSRKEVIQGGRWPRYLDSGHLTFVRSGSLFAVPFDLGTLQLKGDPAPVVEGVFQSAIFSMPNAAISDNGTLVYQSSTVGASPQAPLMWLRRTGGLTPLRTTPAMFTHPRFSPDGRRVAMAIADGRQTDIWVYDWERDILTRVTTDLALDLSPVWTLDGTGIVFGSTRSGAAANLYWQRADGTGNAQRLTTSNIAQMPDSFAPDGRHLVFHAGDPATTRQMLGILPIESVTLEGIKSGETTTFVGGAFLKANPRFSPDGKWIAYAGNDTGMWEIYVQPFPGPGQRIQATNGGGNVVVWSPKQNELYYSSADQGRLMSVAFTTKDGAFIPEKPRPWSEATFAPTAPYSLLGPSFDIHPAGDRFVVAPPSPAVDTPGRGGQVQLFFNLFEELRRVAPAR
jgi:Tol biopolymer transport system component